MKLMQLFLGGIGGLTIGIVLGILIAQGISFAQTGGVNLPFNMEHNDIAYEVIVKVNGENCKLGHCYTTIAEFIPYDIKSITEFAQGGEYTQSLWVFTQENNVQVTMVITGPNSQNGYILEFGRQTPASVYIKAFQYTVDWSQASGEGYALTDVVFP